MPEATLNRRQCLRSLAALGWVGAAGGYVSQAEAHSLRVGTPAPPAVLTTLSGETIRTEALRGQVIIVNFWATWCTLCCVEMPALSAYAASHAAQGLHVLGFCINDEEQLPAVRKMASSLSFPVGLLARSQADGYGRIWRLPASFVIDRSGLLAHNSWDAKAAAWTEERLQSIVSPLL